MEKSSGATKDPKWVPSLQLTVGKKEKEDFSATRGLKFEKDLEKKLLVPPRDERQEMRKARKEMPKNAGKSWFDLPAKPITPELKQELRLLRLRSVMDPKHHYKKTDKGKFPTHFQIGTVVEGAADYYNGRLSRKERKHSFSAEFLADSNLKTYRKRKYEEIQELKQAGGKKFFKQMRNRRKPSWAKL